MKYLLNSLLLICCLMLSLLMNSCSNELGTIESADQQAISTENEDINTLQSLGFNTSNIVEMATYYLVEGDIIFEKSKLSNDKAQTRQAYHTTGLIKHPNQRTITVGIDSSIPTSGVDNWREEILEAINLWNPLSNLRLAYTTDANPDILILSDDNKPLLDYVIAAAEFPMGGKPGSSIRINLDYSSNKTVPRLQKIYNMVHELGHCFGLRHTNWKSREESAANHIGGTPTSDPNSIMNGGTAESYWNGFSENDRYAIRTLYPTLYASLIGFPGNIISFGKDQFRISVSSSQPIVSYLWNVTAGYIIKPQGGTVISDNESSVTVVFGSPITSSICVYITTIYGERYALSKDYRTQIFEIERIN